VAHARELVARLLTDWSLPAWHGDALYAVRQTAVLTALAAAAHVLRGLGATRRLHDLRTPWLHGLLWAGILAVIALLYPGATERFIYFEF
jgi:hypothetical protein